MSLNFFQAMRKDFKLVEIQNVILNEVKIHNDKVMELMTSQADALTKMTRVAIRKIRIHKMLDLKKSLRSYMENFSGSYIGFFSLLSEIVRELGEDWEKFANEHGDETAKKWGTLFIDTSNTLKQISNSFIEVSDEFNNREVKVEETNPQALIEVIFKNKVLVIKNAKSTNV